LVDLHVHTTASDGTFQPREAAGYARNLGLDAIAITDHDTLAGIAEARQAGARLGIEVIPGVELGCDFGHRELHILGYMFREDAPGFLDKLAQLAQARTRRGKEMVRRLNQLGIPLLWESVANLAGEGTVGRLHIARAIVQEGWAKSYNEAFAKFLNRDKPAYVPRMRLLPASAIELIHQAGGVAVLAHPKLANCDKLIPDLVEAGLDGLEVYHTRHSWQDVAKYRKMAGELGLLITGGSDCHGPGGKGEVLMGQILVDGECLVALEARAQQIKG
jgi:predicted metal-dependent phosphoesterase TrpH